ncbi:MAG TPA: hypothetical protein EYG88_10890 [Desulfocapsa sulfexigens]|nr:hypothetical protein [Desulfocapsa sulfexigens]
MIVNPWTVSALGVDTVSAGLGLITTGLAVKHLSRSWSEKKESGEQLAAIEDSLYLLFWLGSVFLILRFLAWPLFYLALHSLIPEISGAMCIFGARNLQPTLSRILEITKPLLFYAGLVWLLVFRLERFGNRAGSESLARKSSLILLCVCSIAGLVDSCGSAILWLRSNSELAVSCCTTVTDIPSRFTVWIPESIFGSEYETLLWVLYFFSNAILVLGTLIVRSRLLKSITSGYPFLLLLVLVLINCVIGTFAFIEVISPYLMDLPFHHCLYCLVQNIMDAPIFVALFILGNSLVGAIYPVWLLSIKWSEKPVLSSLVSRLLLLGALCLSGSVLMISTHLLL